MPADACASRRRLGRAEPLVPRRAAQVREVGRPDAGRRERGADPPKWRPCVSSRSDRLMAAPYHRGIEIRQPRGQHSHELRRRRRPHLGPGVRQVVLHGRVRRAEPVGGGLLRPGDQDGCDHPDLTVCRALGGPGSGTLELSILGRCRDTGRLRRPAPPSRRISSRQRQGASRPWIVPIRPTPASVTTTARC